MLPVAIDAEEQVGWFPVPTEEQLPNSLRGLFNQAKDRLASCPMFFACAASGPNASARGLRITNNCLSRRRT